MDTALLIKAFGALFAIMNPFAHLPLFLSLTTGRSVASQRCTALRIAGYSAVICAVFLATGTSVLRFFGVSVDHFRVAGGLVLLTIGLSMLSGAGFAAHEGSRRERSEQEEHAHDPASDVSFFPMAFPVVVGPGTITTIIVMDAQAQGLGGHVAVVAAIALVLVVLAVVLFFAAQIGQHLSLSLRMVMTRLMGMILLSNEEIGRASCRERV
mgnify:FL=1